MEKSDTITLNSVDLTISSARIIYANGSEEVATVNYVQSQEIVNLHFNKGLNISTDSMIFIEFTGILNDKMKGFYRSKYFDQDGKERFAAVTQFEATDARRCFPCWDVSSFHIIKLFPFLT